MTGGGQCGGRLLRGVAAAALLAVAAGCAGGFHSDAPASQVYVLRATAKAQVPADSAPGIRPTPSVASSIHVQRPVTGPGLDSDHIVLVQSDHRMSYYSGSRWPAAVPAVVEALAIDTLRASGSWATVQDSASVFPSDYMLQIVVRRFEADYTRDPGVPDVHVVFDCTLGRRVGREVVESFIAEGSATAAANRLGDVVAAFEQATNQALGSIAQSASRVARDTAQQAP